MDVPALLYGTNAEVWKRCRKVLSGAIRRDESMVDAFEAEGLTDTHDHPGLIVLDGPDAFLGKSEHFHCYVPMLLLRPGIASALGPLGQELENKVLQDFLRKPWSFLCLLDGNNMAYWFPRHTHEYYRQYLRKRLHTGAFSTPRGRDTPMDLITATICATTALPVCRRSRDLECPKRPWAGSSHYRKVA